MIAAPLFHAWGFAQWALGISLASTVVLKRKFDEEATLSLTAQHGCTALVVVPVMIQRILELRRRGARPLRPVEGQSGAGVRLRAARARSRTAGWTTSARTSTTSTARPRWRGRRSPRRATCARRPGTVGRPPRGSVVKIYDEDGKPVPQRRDRPDLRRQRRPVRGLHGRRQQGRDRRAAVLRRRRPLRRRRAACSSTAATTT